MRYGSLRDKWSKSDDKWDRFGQTESKIDFLKWNGDTRGRTSETSHRQSEIKHLYPGK